MKDTVIKPILFVHPGYELYGSDRMLLLSIQTVRKKYPEKPIIVVLPKEGILIAEILKIGHVTVIIKKIGVVRKYDFRRFNFSAIPRILTFFRLVSWLNSFDVVYINTITVIDYMLASRFCKAKVIIHVHELPGKFPAKVFGRLLSFSMADLIFVSLVSKLSFRQLRNERQHVLWNGCKAFQKTERVTDPDGKVHLLLIGRINRRKGQPLLIKALHLLPLEERNRIRLRIVGDVYSNQSRLKNDLIQMIGYYRLEEIIELHPFTLTPEDHYNWSDAVLLPSLLPESFGLVAIEAMSLGKLVIAANLGGLQEIIQHNVNGILFDPGNEADLAEKISNIIRSVVKIDEIGEQAQFDYQEKFTEEIYVEKLFRILSH